VAASARCFVQPIGEVRAVLTSDVAPACSLQRSGKDGGAGSPGSMLK